MRHVQVDSMESLIHLVNDLPNNYLYRGQANADWKLESSLERVIGSAWSAEKAQIFEEYSLKSFCSKFHLYDRENAQPETKFAWLSTMQHYGVPTRLIDFTESPYVALYFALESYGAKSGNDLALYAIDYAKVLDSSIDHIRARDSAFKESRKSITDRQDEIFDNVVDRFSYDIVWIAEPKILNARLDRQAGSFMMSGNRGLRIEELLGSNIYAEANNIKFVIPAGLYENIFALLRKVNITSKSIYGDLNGLAQSIKMQMQVYAS